MIFFLKFFKLLNVNSGLKGKIDLLVKKNSSTRECSL